MAKQKDWGGWELAGVIVFRRNRNDESDTDTRIIKQAMAMPAGRQHCVRVWKGGKVYLSVLGNEIECVGDDEANTLMELFHLQYGLGDASRTISKTVHDAPV